MVNRIEYTSPPMIVPPVRNGIIEKDLVSDPSNEDSRDTVFLENRKEIKAQRFYGKGLFIDYYV